MVKGWNWRRMVSKKHLEKIFVMIGMLIYTAVLYVFQLGCPILKITRMPCPGCGMTRAWLAVLRFDFVAAFSYHFMFWSVPVLCLFLWCDGRVFKNEKYNRGMCILIALGFLINWLLKMSGVISV